MILIDDRDMIEIIKSKQRKLLVIASAALTLLLILQAAPNAMAETMFSFHIGNFESGKKRSVYDDKYVHRTISMAYAVHLAFR